MGLTRRVIRGAAAAAALTLALGSLLPSAASAEGRESERDRARITVPVSTDNVLCAALLTDEPFSSIDVNLRKLAQRLDASGGTADLEVTLIALEESVKNPSTFIDCAWVDENNDQRYQPHEPTSVAVLFTPEWTPSGPGSWKTTFPHRVADAGRRPVCDRVIGFGAPPDDPSIATAFAQLSTQTAEVRDRAAQAVNAALTAQDIKQFRSNRVCSPRPTTDVDEVPFGAALGALAAVAGLIAVVRPRLRARRG